MNLDHDRIRWKLEDIESSLQDLEEFSAQIGRLIFSRYKAELTKE